jgi:hypothetical protein
MENYAELEINVGSKDDDGSYPLEGHADLAGDARGRLRLPSEDPEYQDLAAKFMTFQTSEAILTRLGEKLFAALFQGQMRDLYLGVQGAVRSNPDLGLRIKLVFSAQTAEVAALPWEFISEPGQGPLALLDCSIVRYPELPTPALPLAGSLPLRVLLTSAVTPPPTTIAEELDAVEKALKRLGRQVEVTKEPHLTGTGLRQLLSRKRDEQFHVWHFVGHGGVGADGSTGMLVLEDPASQSGEPGRLADPALFSALQLRIILNRSGVRLIVLDACETGKLGTDAFRSLAPQLIQAQIPAVVAMQFSVPDDVTVAFATAFYQSLAQSLPIDACVNEGRKEVMAAVGLDRPDWGIPVVYTRAADGRLFELSGPETGTPAADPRSKQPVPPSEPVLPPPDHSRSVQHSSMAGNQGGVNIQVGDKGIEGSSINISGIRVENVGAAGNAPKSDLTVIAAIGGAPLDIRRDDAVRSEIQFNDEVNSLSSNITLLQRTLRLLEQRAAISGSMADPSLPMEIESKEKQMLLLLQQRIELRLGRREYLQDRQKAATARQEQQQLEEQIRAVSYEYLSDAMALKRAEVKQLQARANNALDVERDQILRHIDEIRREIGLLDAQRRRQEPA